MNTETMWQVTNSKELELNKEKNIYKSNPLNNEKIIDFYIRGERRARVVIMEKRIPIGARMFAGISVRSPKDRENRKRALYIARVRAVLGYVMLKGMIKGSEKKEFKNITVVYPIVKSKEREMLVYDVLSYLNTLPANYNLRHQNLFLLPSDTIRAWRPFKKGKPKEVKKGVFVASTSIFEKMLRLKEKNLKILDIKKTKSMNLSENNFDVFIEGDDLPCENNKIEKLHVIYRTVHDKQIPDYKIMKIEKVNN